MKQETLKKYINHTFGNYTVLDIDHEEYNKENYRKRTYFKCKCNRCGKECIVRSDKMTSKRFPPKCCQYCVNDQQKETAERKYKIKDTKYLRNRINSIKGNAKTRHYNIELTDKQILDIIKQPCYYCNQEIALGIDRLDSTKNYTLDNCVPCCFICNRMKNKYSLQTFLEKIRLIYNKFYNKSSTTISKESTSEANADGSGEHLNVA